MAIDKGFSGFETGWRDSFQSFSGNINVACDRDRARTGDFYLQVSNASAVSGGYTEVQNAGAQTFPAVDGTSVNGKMRFYFRVKALPSTNQHSIGGWTGSLSIHRVSMALNSNGTFHCKAGSSTYSAASSTVLALDTWYKIEIDITVTNLPATTNSQCDGELRVYTEGGTLLETLTASSVQSSTNAMSHVALGNRDTSSATCCYHYDDLYWIHGGAGDSISLPTADRVTGVLPTAISSATDWTGTVDQVRCVPRGAGSVTSDEMATSTDEAEASFTHKTAAQLGLSGIEGFKLNIHMKTSSFGTADAMTINGVETAYQCQTTYPSGQAPAEAYDWTIDDSNFDAMVFGAKNKRGVAVQLAMLVGEVLHAGDNVPSPDANEGVDSYQHATGTYTGTGAVQSVNVGFRPMAVIVHRHTGASSGGPNVVKTRGHGGTTASAGTNLRAKAIIDLTDTGFTLGPDTSGNTSGSVYSYIAIRDGGHQSRGRFFYAGVYHGNGFDGIDVKAVPGESFQPDVILIPNTSAQGVMRTPDHGSAATDRASTLGNSSITTDTIQAINADGFEVGSSSAANQNSASIGNTHYPYLVWKFGDLGLLEMGLAYHTWVGNASNPRAVVTGMAFAPAWILTDGDVAGVDAFVRTPLDAGTSSQFWSSVSNTTSAISAVAADGFSVQSFMNANLGNYFAISLASSLLIEPITDEVEFGGGDDQSGNVIGLTWAELYHADTNGNDQAYLWGPVDLNDDPDYYGGYKEPRVLGFGEITRALSDGRGQYEASEFSMVVADTDRLIRGWLGRIQQKYLLNRQIVLRMIDDASRRLQLIPRTLARGIVRSYKPRGPLHFEFRAKDFVASLFGSANSAKQIPQEAVSRAQFPGCPVEAIGKPVPIIFGQLSNSLSQSAAPVLTGTSSRGAVSDGVNWGMGFGDLESDAAIPTGVMLTLAGGGTLSTDVPNGQYGVVVTAIDASGRETDPVPFYFDGPGEGRGSFAFAGTVPNVTPNGSEKIQVSWSAAAGAAKYRVYLGWYYYGYRPTQFIEVTAPTTSCEFTANPPWQDNITTGNITPGAQQIQFTQFWYYAVSAVLPDGETGLSATAFGITRTHRRELRLEWLPVTDATSYKVYRRGAAGTWDRYWEVPATQTHFDDDLLDTDVNYISGAAELTGAVPVRFVGMENDDFGFPWYSFLVCGHQVDEIPHLFQNGQLVDAGNFGVTILVPGQTGYSSYFSTHTGSPQKKTVNGRDYTMIYARGPQGDAAANGSQPFTCNVAGRRDAEGELITQLADIYKDFVINWGFQDCAGGHLDAPTWDEDVDGTIRSKVDEASFDTMKAVHERRLDGGYPGAIAYGLDGNFVTLRDAMAQLNISNDCDSGFNRNSEFFVSIFDEAIAVLDEAREYTQLNDIIKDQFDMDPDSDGVENVVVYSFRRLYVKPEGKGDWDVEEAEVEDETAIDDLREERRSTTLELWGVRSATVAQDIAMRRLLYRKEPPVTVTIQTNLKGLSTELGDVIKVSHTEGASATGWSERPLRVLRHVTDPSKYTVKLVAVDVERLYAGAFILGDETALAADWDDADDADRRYGYLCDEETGQFSNGNLGKRLR
jgi:hypothetical protein